MSGNFEIDKIAQLARIELIDEEKEKYAQQIGGVLEYVEELGEYRNPKLVEGSLHDGRDNGGGVQVGIINGVTDIMREDEIGESLKREEALKNAPAQKDGFIQVKGVFREDSTESS